MKTCPYCKNPIDESWSYCRNCNKPLIANLEDIYDRTDRFTYTEPEIYHLDNEEEDQEYNKIVIEDEEIEQKLEEINSILERKEVLGEDIPGSLLLEKSSLYYRKRDIPEALKNLNLAITNFEKENDLANVAICHNELGIIQEDNGFFDQAIYHFNRSIDILKSLNEKSKMIKVFNNLGNVYFLINDIEQSYYYYQEAYQLSLQENLVFEEVKSSSNLVEVLYLLKDYNRIKGILTKNLDFFTANEDIYGMIQINIKFGKLYYKIRDNLDESLQHLRRALELIDLIKEHIDVYVKAKLEWECFLYLGKINMMKDNLTKGENFFLQSLEAVRIFELGENIKEGEILENIAELYLSKGDYDKSMEYYNLTCEIFYKFGDNRKNAELKFKIGKIILEFEEDSSKAINYIEEALAIYEELDYIKECALIYHKLGDIYVNTGLTDQAIYNFENAVNYYLKMEDEYNVNLLKEKIFSLKNQSGINIL